MLLAVLAPAFAGPARAAVVPGGVGAGGAVSVADVICVKQCIAVHKVRPGSTVRFRGSDLEEVSQVVFRGAGGPLKVTPMRRTERAATAVVPEGAVAGRPYVIDQAGHQSRPAPHKLFVLAPTTAPAPVVSSTATAYPIAGPHELWEGFGGTREHGGVDVGAACGTPLIAALPGKVEYNKYESRAGNYLVIDAEGVDADIIYMHMTAPSSLKVGTLVTAGTPVGTVGDTGNASGCHLHFEYWMGEAWLGGEAVDPLPYLKAWEAAG
ncbi:MAG: M23 family metallopeptidase [Actinobacteria bacterium]|nr:M23 family metallopeptidase [Actinomycetota bacterium]